MKNTVNEYKARIQEQQEEINATLSDRMEDVYKLLNELQSMSEKLADLYEETWTFINEKEEDETVSPEDFREMNEIIHEVAGGEIPYYNRRFMRVLEDARKELKDLIYWAM